MSIIIKSMKAGTVTVNEFNSYIELLPVMIHIHDQHLPYYVVEDSKIVFQGNLEYLEAQKQPANSYTLKIKKADSVSVETFHDFTALSAAAMVANNAGLPWFIVDDNTGKLMRKGNCDNLQQSTPAPKAGVVSMPEPEPEMLDIDIDAALDEMNDAVSNFDDDCDRPHHVKLTGFSQIVYIENGEVKRKSFSNTEEDAEEFCKNLFVANMPYMIVTYGGYGQPSYEFHNDTTVRHDVELDSITPAARQAIESVLEEGPHDNGGKQEFYWRITEKAGYYLLMVDEGEDCFEDEVINYYMVDYNGGMF